MRSAALIGVSLCLLTFWAVGLTEGVTAERSFTLTVDAGPSDRRDTVVSFTLPDEARARSYRLRDASGGVTLVQADARRQATFVLSELKAGRTKSFTLEPARQPSIPIVSLRRDGDDLEARVPGRTIFRYRGGKGTLPRADIKPILRRGGYLHPVYTPKGRVVTDDYPPNHAHHHGVWSAWTKTEFKGRQPDFWNMGDGKGAVEFVSVGAGENGLVYGRLQAEHRFLDLLGPAPEAVLKEDWEVRVYGTGVFDLIATQTCLTDSPLILPEYHYGGMGFRGHRQWDGKDNAVFLTSEGKTRADGHATRARWCYIGGRVDGEPAGMVIFCHPENFRAPQPMRIHPTEPFFCYAPSQLGRWEIAPGRPYVMRYRFLAYDGPPDKAEFERQWNDYANPPRVTVRANQ